jgi:hypothetical protein
VGGQGDADGFVSIDTFFAKDHDAISYRLRVTLFRRAGTTATPTFTRLSAIASNYRNSKGSFPSHSDIGSETDFDVPGYSQELHHNEFPQFDGGGEAWCSPTSTSMVVAYWDNRTRATATRRARPTCRAGRSKSGVLSEDQGGTEKGRSSASSERGGPQVAHFVRPFTHEAHCPALKRLVAGSTNRRVGVAAEHFRNLAR